MLWHITPIEVVGGTTLKINIQSASFYLSFKTKFWHEVYQYWRLGIDNTIWIKFWLLFVKIGFVSAS